MSRLGSALEAPHAYDRALDMKLTTPVAVHTVDATLGFSNVHEMQMLLLTWSSRAVQELSNTGKASESEDSISNSIQYISLFFI